MLPLDFKQLINFLPLPPLGAPPYPGAHIRFNGICLLACAFVKPDPAGGTDRSIDCGAPRPTLPLAYTEGFSDGHRLGALIRHLQNAEAATLHLYGNYKVLGSHNTPEAIVYF